MTREQAKQKARELVSKMTLEEKASQLLYTSPAIERLGIHPYNWWNEALHGVARADVATVFPQSIGLAATFDPELIQTIADIISTEGRIKNRVANDFGDYGIYHGLTYWSPNINIFRDPRWGRGQETYGEDPYLTSRIGVSFVKGIQGDGEFLKAAACAKHYAVHSGPEKMRHGFNAEATKKDLYETYLPAFEALTKEANVEGFMGAYNRTNGEPTCAHSYLMSEVLFKDWGFDGYFVSDCGAINDFHAGHKVTADAAESTALALNVGCNINCGVAYNAALEAVERGILTEETITENAVRAFTTRFLLGEFEEHAPYSEIPYEKLDCEEHRMANLETARRTMVLLKNDGILPLDAEKKSKIAVIGPNATSIPCLVGNYNGEASQYVTLLDGIRAQAANSRVFYSVGCHHLLDEQVGDVAAKHLGEAIAAARNAETVILCMGINASIEGEEMPGNNGYSDGGDRISVKLPDVQLDLIRRITDINDNVILVLTTGSPVDIGQELRNKVRAIIHAWYPGAMGGQAVGELIFGKFSPSGKLPITFPDVKTKLPDICDYSMQGRTYRYCDDVPAFPFGFGLSYAKFEYENVKLISFDWDNGAKLSASITNTSDIDARETVQVYAHFTDSRTTTPKYQLCGLGSYFIGKNETVRAEIDIPAYWLKAVDEDGNRIIPDGNISLYIGSHQPDDLSCSLSGNCCVEVTVKER